MQFYLAHYIIHIEAGAYFGLTVLVEMSMQYLSK